VAESGGSVDGAWTFHIQYRGAPPDAAMVLLLEPLDGQTTGSYAGPHGEIPLAGSVDGNTLKLEGEQGGISVRIDAVIERKGHASGSVEITQRIVQNGRIFGTRLKGVDRSPYAGANSARPGPPIWPLRRRRWNGGGATNDPPAGNSAQPFWEHMDAQSMRRMRRRMGWWF
jgi:hypothetical protein